MKVKKFTAKSMPDAMKSIRSELGNDAVILNSRIVYTGGFLGLFRKKNFEIIAAADHVAKQEAKPVRKATPKAVEAMSKQPPQQQPAKTSVKLNEANINQSQSEEILREIGDLKELIQTKNIHITHSKGIYPEPVEKLVNLIREQEISPVLMDKFTEALMAKWFSEGGNLTTDQLVELLKQEIIKNLADLSFGGITFTKKFINVVGPTGVGKTTTLAKIAAECMLNHHKKVAFITTDTYRIAAIEQLKTYAQILKVPVEVCYTIEDFQGAVKKFASYDLVLIDTAGRNFRNKQYVEDLRKIIDFSLSLENYLVLALTSKQKDMESICQQFSSLKIDKFIFTKVDETNVYGAMINMIDKYRIGAAYITNGQEVPDDFMIASPEAIANLLTGAN